MSYANVGGAVTPAYEIEVDPNKLAAAGLTLSDVMTTVSSDNQRVPGWLRVFVESRDVHRRARRHYRDVATVALLPINATPASRNRVDARRR